MIPLPSGSKIFIRPGATDGRAGMATLAIIAEGVMKENPFSGNLFLFMNKKKTTIKGLYWDATGFCLWQKKLSEDRFHWPAAGGADRQELSIKELQWLLDGLNLARLKPHHQKKYQSVI